MSDFIYTRKRMKEQVLSQYVTSIYEGDSPFVMEYHGEWGSLAVSRSHYAGFEPYETEKYICIVIGGPVLCYEENKHLAFSKNNEGTSSIFHRWKKGEFQPEEDVSGPFVLFIMDKETYEMTCMTDLMSFIPVYVYQEKENVMLSTHVDVLAKASDQSEQIDEVSQVDFVLYGAVTYPYTNYINIKQIAPASIHEVKGSNFHVTPYWIPKEENKYHSLADAAKELRKGLESYVNAITDHTDNVAQFLSGGEDSRVISALLAHKKNRNAYIFLEEMNREGEIAEKAAKAYDANLKVVTHNKMRYLTMLPNCSELVGSGAQYFHVHTYGIHKECQFEKYTAVFGGLLADALLKGSHIRKLKGTHLVPFFPHIKRGNYSASESISHPVFKKEVLVDLQKRRTEHLNYVKEFRTESAEEWFELWPSSMNVNISNIHGNRRLFSSYEPFTAKDVVKLSAKVSQSWKLNRRLFHKAVKPYLKPTQWLFHGEGKLPYYPWYINSFVQASIWSVREIEKKVNKNAKYQGPWFDWNSILSSKEWKETVSQYSDGLSVLEKQLNETDLQQLFQTNQLNFVQKINLLQMLYVNHTNKK
ncbi:asparagine synthase-related protein [Evansella sp. AB-rgal1]|uniref:asparagine synthase-related protein n=1 Tax=Evansella sp. AB-rgal1 TaxID=3242696 RepID=UPI00359EB1FC